MVLAERRYEHHEGEESDRICRCAPRCCPYDPAPPELGYVVSAGRFPADLGTHYKEITEEGNEEQRGIEHDVDSQILGIQEVLPWAARIVTIIDIHQLYSHSLNANVDGLYDENQCNIR